MASTSIPSATPEENRRLREIVADGNVEIPPTSSSLFRCAYCDRYSRDCKLKRCTKCRSVLYCDKSCQVKDWTEHNHRARCENIAVRQEDLKELAHGYQNEGAGIDVFDRAYGFIGTFCAHGPNGIGSMGRQYCQYRMDVAEALMDEAVARLAPPLTTTTTKKKKKHGAASNKNTNNNNNINDNNYHHPHYNQLALELALEHSLDLLHLDHFNHPSLVRSTWTPHIYLVLGRYQELYNYVKFWCYSPPKFREIRRHSDFFDERLDRMLGSQYFLNLKDQNVFEDQTELNLRLPSPRPSKTLESFPGPTKSEVVCILYVVLAKLQIYQIIQGVKLLGSGLIASRIASFLGVKDAWMAMADPELILQQCRELFRFAGESIPDFLSLLIYQPSLPNADPYYASVTPMLWLKTAWASHPFAWQFLKEFLKNDGASPTTTITVPRNGSFQTVLNDGLRQFMNEQTRAPSYLRGVQHFNNQRTSAAVRDLFCETMTNSSHLLLPILEHEEDFCTTRILTALREQGKDTVENFVLLFGDATFPAVGIEVDRLIAAETLEHARYHPTVCKFRFQHDLVISAHFYVNEEEEEAENRIEFFDLMDEAYMELAPHSPFVVAAVKLLTEKKLATKENLELFFGDAGRVADLLTYFKDLQ